MSDQMSDQIFGNQSDQIFGECRTKFLVISRANFLANQPGQIFGECRTKFLVISRANFLVISLTKFLVNAGPNFW